VAPKTFADALKEARRAAGLSQSALARRAGLTGSYISLLESRRRPPPSPRVVRSVCRVLGIPAGPLLEAAAVERSPPTVRKRLEHMREESGRVQRTRDRLLTTTLFHLARRPRVVEPMAEFLDLDPGQQALLGRLLGRIRRARSLDEVAAKPEEILEEASAEDRDALVEALPRALAADAPDGPATAKAPRPEPPRAPVHDDLARRVPPRGWRDVAVADAHPDLFFWRVQGDEAHPRFEAGDLVLVDPRREPREGDVVVVEHQGRGHVGTYLRRGDEVQVVFPRPEVPPIRVRASGFRPAGVVVRLERDLS